jgi:hypothetical protein
VRTAENDFFTDFGAKFFDLVSENGAGRRFQLPAFKNLVLNPRIRRFGSTNSAQTKRAPRTGLFLFDA